MNETREQDVDDLGIGIAQNNYRAFEDEFEVRSQHTYMGIESARNVHETKRIEYSLIVLQRLCVCTPAQSRPQ